MIFDTHAHLNFAAFKDDYKEVISRSIGEGMKIINVGSFYKTSKRAVEIAEEYNKDIYAAVGLHPIHVKKEEFNEQLYIDLLKSEKVVALGETGLDKKEDRGGDQMGVFQRHIDIVEQFNLPVIIHCRMAHKEVREELAKHKIRGVIHCFTGSKKDARDYIKKGFYLGFNGIIFKMDLSVVIKETPIERMLLETDCPYLTPPQEEGRNEPIYTKYTAQKIAEIKGVSLEEVIQITKQNANSLFIKNPIN